MDYRVPCRGCSRKRLPNSPGGMCYGCRAARALACSLCGASVSLRNRHLLCNPCREASREGSAEGPREDDPPRLHELHARAKLGLPLFPDARDDEDREAEEKLRGGA